jgi:hypothetical protein
VLAGDPWTRFLATVYAGVLRHQYGPTYRYATVLRPWIGPKPLSRVEFLLRAGGPLRLVADERTIASLRRFAAGQPPGRVVVVDVRDLR